jgi:hypothetical protein
MARTESLLAAVGARLTPAASFSADALDTALFDFVCDVDLVAGLSAIDAKPISVAVLRAASPPARRRRMTWRVLIPTATSGIAATAIAITTFVVGSSSSTSPAVAASAESRQLLTHADTLLTAASHAAAADRADLVTEAQADLSHVSRLLPLADPESRPEIRDRMAALDERAEPLAAKPPRRTASANNGTTGRNTSPTGANRLPNGGATGGAGSGSRNGDGTDPPVRERPVRRTVAFNTDAGARTTAPATDGGAVSGEPTTNQPAPRSQPISGTQQSPLDATTAQQPPPADSAPPPRR